MPPYSYLRANMRYMLPVPANGTTGEAVQGALWDEPSCEPSLDHYACGVSRERLTRGAWIDMRPLWLHGGEQLMADLVEGVPWRAERRKMYDRTVDVPRLLKFYDEGDQLPHPVLQQAMDALNQHYREELGERFVTAGLCYYRDGRDSVAWHGDRVGRSRMTDTMIAILSLGTTRRLALRPRGGGSSIGYNLGQGDVIVMGGSCQRTWEHAIPKTARPVGARISVQFRVRGVR